MNVKNNKSIMDDFEQIMVELKKFKDSSFKFVSFIRDHFTGLVDNTVG